MRTYIHLFMNLLLPLSLLFVVASIGYFTFSYDFSKAIKLGILSGVLVGISVSFVMAFVLLILSKVQKKGNTRSPLQEETIAVQEVTTEHRKPKQKTRVAKEIKCMLLMDRELTFDVILHAFKKEEDCTLSASDPQKGTMTIQTKEGIIQTTITSLTQHTSQIILLTQSNAAQVKKLIANLKEKEQAFLQY